LPENFQANFGIVC